jgi:hypothetical protein
MRVAQHSLAWAAILVVFCCGAANGDDVKIRPATGDGLVVTDTAGTNERLRVNENGQVFLPALGAHAAPDGCLCTDAATGRVGTCPLPVPGQPIILACAEQAITCPIGSSCPVDVLLEATCPAGYTRLRLWRCREPHRDSPADPNDPPPPPNIVATLHMDPYDPTKLGCHYTGSLEQDHSDTLAVAIWCIQTPAQPCLVD